MPHEPESSIQRKNQMNSGSFTMHIRKHWTMQNAHTSLKSIPVTLILRQRIPKLKNASPLPDRWIMKP